MPKDKKGKVEPSKKYVAFEPVGIKSGKDKDIVKTEDQYLNQIIASSPQNSPNSFICVVVWRG